MDAGGSPDANPGAQGGICTSDDGDVSNSAAGENENVNSAVTDKSAIEDTASSPQRQSYTNGNLKTIADKDVHEGFQTDIILTKMPLSETNRPTISDDTQTNNIVAEQTSASSETTNKKSNSEFSVDKPTFPSSLSSKVPDKIADISDGLSASADDSFTAGNVTVHSQPALDSTESENQTGHSLQTPSASEKFHATVPDSAARLPISDEEAGAVAEGVGGVDVVVVTGGSGFLGQHIVKMLQERAPHVLEIRILDVKEFEQKLDYVAKKPVKSLVGSIVDNKFVGQALRGAHSVIHVAGLISWGTFPDFAGMEETNVVGTVNVFNACIKNNVHRLVYCSTVDVAVGFQPIKGGDEENTPAPPPDGFMFPGYPETKYQGERVILNSTRVRRQDGENLQTLILRANVLYGELDHAYVTNGLKMANQSKGVLRQIGDGMAMFQQAYVGNTAWAFVRADMAMRENPELTAQVFYVPDHTPVQNSFNFMRPYLEARGFRLSESRLSYTLVHSAVRFAEVVAKGLSPIYKLNLPVQSYSVTYINTSIYFSGEKAKKVLGYEPIITPNEARHASLEYYKTVELDKKEE